MAARATSNRRWIERLARFGFTARGLVYILVGVLAVAAYLVVLLALRRASAPSCRGT